MNFGNIQKICLIGSGEPMVHCAQALRAANVNVVVILASRHAHSELPLAGQMLSDALKSADIPYLITPEINDQNFVAERLEGADYDLALCFGPAWVFGKRVREAFSDKMLNFNGIPIPRYLGGAHYTWQILNGDKTSGMAIQHITDRIDKGDILRYEERMLPESVRIPQDYFRENYAIACDFLERFVNDLLCGVDFPTISFDSQKSRRLYFPRLLTLHQAFINWTWAGSDIEKFCNAFDAPYAGASTYIDQKRVFFKSVEYAAEPLSDFHPFCNGLVIRKVDDCLYVSVEGGHLLLKTVLNEDGHNIASHIREGARFHTPQSQLDEALSFVPVISGTKAG